MKLSGYNLYFIEPDAETEEDIVLLTYLAIYKGLKVAHTRDHLKRKLNILRMPLEFFTPFLKTTSKGVFSAYSNTGKPINFTNPSALCAKIPCSAKVNYIRLTSLISNEQRWRYKIWKEPIVLPLQIIDSIDQDIPTEWIQTESTNLRMREEENYYGN